jgi:hypothetical protein
MMLFRYGATDADGFKVFYRKAGPADAPKLLLRHEVSELPTSLPPFLHLS